MQSTTSAKHFKLHRNILAELGCQLSPGAHVLDFGCGAGHMVTEYRRAGFAAWGCDLKVQNELEFVRPLDKKSRIIPFPDDTFDFVFSDQVLEHVKDHKFAISEIKRVMKPNGISLHIFPAKLKPTEAHNFVPLGGCIQCYSWLLLWAFLGVRNSFQKGKTFRQVAQINYTFLKDQTAYLSKSEIREAISDSFAEITFAERHMIKHSYGGAHYLYPLLRLMPFLASVYSTFYTRVIFLKKEC